MRAEIQPLRGKYYGTEIKTNYGTIKVWLRGRGPDVAWADKPSHRQITEWGKPDDGETVEEFHRDMMCDGHYETMLSYVVAQAIEESLANVEVP